MSAGTDLYRVSDDFASLLRLRDIMLSEGEDVGPLEQTIAEYFSGDITRERIDVVIGALRYAETMEAAAKAEAERCAKMARSWQTQREWLKGTVQRVMEMAGKKRLEGHTAGHLLLKGNGGKPAVTITDDSLIPYEFKTLTIKVNAATWNAFQKTCQEANQSTALALSALIASESFSGSMEPHKGRIAAALEKEPVPGARLEPRGAHVEVK